MVAWLFIAPALLFYSAFVLIPICTTAYYSLLRWNGIGVPQFRGIQNYLTVLSEPYRQCLSTGPLFYRAARRHRARRVAQMIRSHLGGKFGTTARAILFIPQVIPLVAAGIAWSWMLASNGVINQLLSLLGLGSWTRRWLGDFDFALPAVGIIGAWVLLGLCTMLLVTGIATINPTHYEAAKVDGASGWDELIHITIPGVRQENRGLRHGHGDRRCCQFRYCLRRNGRRPGRGDQRAGTGDLPARLRSPSGGPRVCARHCADDPRDCLHPGCAPTS